MYQLSLKKGYYKCYLTTEEFEIANDIAEKRYNFYKKKECKYGHCTLTGNIIGAIGEVGTYKILQKNFNNYNFITLYNQNKSVIGDIIINNIHVEIKSRTLKDWRIYGSQMPYDNYTFLQNKINELIILWISVNKKNEISINGWNKLTDFKKWGKIVITGNFNIKYIKIYCIRSMNQLNKYLKYLNKININNKKNK